MTIIDSLRSVNAYPIPTATLTDIAEGSGIIAPEEELSWETRQTDEFKRATAKVYAYLAEAPNISQGGITYSFSATERERFEKKASAILAEIDEQEAIDFVCGYIGEDF